MATRRTTFDKLQRERAKKAKAAAKRDRRLETPEETDEIRLEDAPHEDPAVVLAQIERIHEQFAAKQLGYEDFEKQKVELFARLAID